MDRPVGTPLAARPDGMLITGQRLMMLKQMVISQCAMVFCGLRLIISVFLTYDSPALVAGNGSVGQIRMRFFSRIGPSVLYIAVSISSPARKSAFFTRLASSAKSIA